jgi:ribonucleoside-diphosphate reductase alpha chain
VSTVSTNPDEGGTPGEIFLVMAKEGPTISGLTNAFATLISKALRYGVLLPTLVEKLNHMRLEPAGFAGNPEIPLAECGADSKTF